MPQQRLHKRQKQTYRSGDVENGEAQRGVEAQRGLAAQRSVRHQRDQRGLRRGAGPASGTRRARNTLRTESAHPYEDESAENVRLTVQLVTAEEPSALVVSEGHAIGELSVNVGQ